MRNSQENPTDVEQETSQANTQAGPLHPWEIKIPDSCNQSRPPPCGIYRKSHRCRAGTRTSKTTSRNRPGSTGDDKKPPQEGPSTSQVSASLRFTTWHNHSQQALSTTSRATSRCHAGNPTNRPASQLSSTAVLPGNARVPGRRKRAMGQGHQPCK